MVPFVPIHGEHRLCHCPISCGDHHVAELDGVPRTEDLADEQYQEPGSRLAGASDAHVVISFQANP
jgi:hypothetical protein